MCSGPIITVPMLPPVETVRPGQIIMVNEDYKRYLGVPQQLVRPKEHNCRNCGAPPEPVCSYCGTHSA